jgi:hypothetical protein
VRQNMCSYGAWCVGWNASGAARPRLITHSYGTAEPNTCRKPATRIAERVFVTFARGVRPRTRLGCGGCSV